MEKAEISVGDELWVVANERFSMLDKKDGFSVRVTKMGSQWIQLSNGQRCDKDTLLIDTEGVGWSDQCYRSKSAWQRHQVRLQLWDQLRDTLTSYAHRPDPNKQQPNAEQILSAATLLGINLDSTWKWGKPGS